MLRVQMDSLLKSHKKLLDRLGSICSSYGDILLAAPVTRPNPRYVQLVEQLCSLVLENTPTYSLLGVFKGMHAPWFVLVSNRYSVLFRMAQ